jgi:N-acetylmuramoyl-L-alanine amidase
MASRIFKALLLLCCALFVETILFASSPLHGRVILLDAGHGTINFEGKIINPGRESREGNIEHRLSLEIVQKLGEMLENSGAKVFYTRTPGDYWRQAYSTVDDNKTRGHLANELKAEAFISIHCDWSPLKKIHGVTTIYGKPFSKKLGSHIHRNMLRRLQAHDRKLVQDSYTILDVSEVPSVIVETGFLSNKKESKSLARSAYQKEIAAAITKALRTYFEK